MDEPGFDWVYLVLLCFYKPSFIATLDRKESAISALANKKKKRDEDERGGGGGEGEEEEASRIRSLLFCFAFASAAVSADDVGTLRFQILVRRCRAVFFRRRRRGRRASASISDARLEASRRRVGYPTPRTASFSVD